MKPSMEEKLTKSKQPKKAVLKTEGKAKKKKTPQNNFKFSKMAEDPLIYEDEEEIVSVSKVAPTSRSIFIPDKKTNSRYASAMNSSLSRYPDPYAYPETEEVKGGFDYNHRGAQWFDVKPDSTNPDYLEEQSPKVTDKAYYENLVMKALQEERTAPYGRSKLMVVGEGRAGKTSTIQSLLNKVFNPNQESTKGFDVSRVDASNWKEDDNNYFIEHLQNCITPEASNNKAEGKSSGKEIESTTKIDVGAEEIKMYGENITLGSSKSDNLSFSIWDFGGQKVFYSLHHLFLTEYGMYLLVFNAQELVDDSKKKEAIEYLRFWLFSKKIHAPTAKIIIVGTRCDDLTREELNEVQNVLALEVLKNESFGEISTGRLSFIPIDNKTGTGISGLRTVIEQTVKTCDYIKDEVPVSYLRLLQLLSDSKQEYLALNSVEEIMKKCGLTEILFHKALEFLNSRGLVTFFGKHESLRRFVVLNPQWLVNGITTIIFDENEHKVPEYDPQFSRDFRKFMNEKVVSIGLLKNLWTKKNLEEDVQKFLITVLLESSLMCSYKFDDEDSYLVPALFSPSFIPEDTKVEVEDSEYHGPFFIIDFSGDYDAKIVKDDGKTFVRYMPFGTFERLICLCVDHAAADPESMKPEIKPHSCNLSFGVDIDFQIRTAQNEKGENVWIKVCTETDTSYKSAGKLCKSIYSMIDSLRKDFFSRTGSPSALAISLLLPSSEQSGNTLAEYNLLRDARKNKFMGQKIRPSKVSKKKIHLKQYDQWFENPVKGSKSADDLLNPQADFLKIVEKDPKLLKYKTDAVCKPLPGGLKYHCFLSYKQVSAIDLVGKQYYILEKLGFRCWYDQKFGADINLENMQNGVRDSMVYILFLSKGIFPSYYVEEEVKMALKLKKPIIFLHHPDTGTAGYCNFSEYIDKAPEIVKPLFSQIESIQLQRRHHLEEAVTKLIENRLQKILEGQTRGLEDDETRRKMSRARSV